ncbi:MAG: hypothetical protein A2070_03905 [Bdellovibrionales bacterium GWC1_52_8]|nr:MAG: hypothetical protein A2X97_14825 [Bdellovibrionales bacterium GWA1_52_35]OFZ41234.1 MAG: hypothetical protein A2070_03905 [Bdellovibrionales bacterium GWC1_52_8]
MARPNFIKTFSRSQVSSAMATIADWGLLFTLVEVFKVWYVLATALGACVGGLTNFLVNRNWSFEAKHGALHGQALRYVLISAGSMGLNTAGVWLVTDIFGIHYSISVVGVSLIVGFFFNFPMQRYYVFK